MLTTEPTPEMLQEWKRLHEKYRPKLTPNRRSGTQVDAYFRETYPHTPMDSKELREMIAAEILENPHHAEKLPEGCEPDVRCYLSGDVLVGIDEFHHTSADAESGLGEVVRSLMEHTNAHILAMTGSYFRGDGVPVLRAEDEARFHPVTYNYYQQLNGYKYLKNLQIGYKFYQGKYTDVLPEVLDDTKKTIIHIPSVNARAATGLGKDGEVDAIINALGKVVHIDYNTTVKTVQTPDGRLLKVADLVEDTPEDRNAIQTYLRNIQHRDDMDIIIAKEPNIVIKLTNI